MHFSVLTLFPEMFSALQVGGIVKRSVESRLISIETIDIRDFATDRHRTVDDRPYGGGPGMVFMPRWANLRKTRWFSLATARIS